MENAEDILREMRNAPSHIVDDDIGGCRMVMLETLVGFANRIEAAHAELLRNIYQLEQRLKMCEEVNERQGIDNARLRAALKPVLEFMPYDVWPNAEVMLHRAFAVTEEAKRIYNDLNGDKQSNEN